MTWRIHLAAKFMRTCVISTCLRCRVAYLHVLVLGEGTGAVSFIIERHRVWTASVYCRSGWHLFLKDMTAFPGGPKMHTVVAQQLGAQVHPPFETDADEPPATSSSIAFVALHPLERALMRCPISLCYLARPSSVLRTSLCVSLTRLMLLFMHTSSDWYTAPVARGYSSQSQFTGTDNGLQGGRRCGLFKEGACKAGARKGDTVSERCLTQHVRTRHCACV